MDSRATDYVVVRTAAFGLLLADYRKAHRKIEDDLAWLESKLQLAPEMMGERVPQLQNLALPIYKTRCKDSCCNIGQSADGGSTMRLTRTSTKSSFCSSITNGNTKHPDGNS
jgi:hypothetical protein